MPTNEKIQLVKETEALFKESKAIYFTKYSGMNVSQATVLRKDFRENDVHFRVVKNTLVRIAADNSGFELDKLNDFLNGGAMVEECWSTRPGAQHGGSSLNLKFH